MQIRRDNLEDALLLHQFLRDVDDELQWVAEKQPQAASTDLGTSLTAVQSLQKKHQAIPFIQIPHLCALQLFVVCLLWKIKIKLKNQNYYLKDTSTED